MDDWRSLYPFEPHELALAGLRYHYVDEGQGEPLIFVHGNPTWSFYFRNLIQAFRSDYRCIAPDHIGCGLSDKPQDYNYSLEQHIINLLKLIESLDLQQATLVGHDWGGAIALGAALALPQRISRVVLFNTAAFPPPFIPWRIALCRIPWIGPWAVRSANLFSRFALSMAVEKPERMTPAVQAGLLHPYDSWDNRIGVWRFVNDIPSSHTDPTWRMLSDIEQGVPSLAVKPVQIIWGMRDWCFTPECLARLEQMLPGAEVHRLEDCGHYVVEDAYERIIPLMREFLAKHPVEQHDSAEKGAAK